MIHVFTYRYTPPPYLGESSIFVISSRLALLALRASILIFKTSVFSLDLRNVYFSVLVIKVVVLSRCAMHGTVIYLARVTFTNITCQRCREIYIS